MENMFVGILVSGACGCAAPPAERFMFIAESGRVHLHGVVTRDVVHVNSGVRESPVCLAVSTCLGVYLPRCLPAQVFTCPGVFLPRCLPT